MGTAVRNWHQSERPACKYKFSLENNSELIPKNKTAAN